MKKLTILSILLSLCMFSCDVSETEVNEDGGGSGGAVSPKDVGKKLTAAPSEAEAASMVSEVSVAVAKAGATAEPGSKAWCDIVAEVLKKANGLLLNGDNYTDANLKAQIEVLKQNISKCESNQEVTSFDWYKEGKEEAVKEVGNDCSIPSGLKIQEYYNEGYGIFMAFAGDCNKLDSDLAALDARYPKETQYLAVMRSTCPDLSDVQCPFDACMEKWQFNSPSVTDIAAYEMKMGEIVVQCNGFNFKEDPCAKKTCNVGEFCSSGECVDACSVLNCGADATCSKGFCIPNNPEQPAKTCTEDPTICNGGQCVNGQCVASQQPANINCDAYPKTKEALVNAILTATSCQDLDNKMDAAVAVAISEGINEDNWDDIDEACSDKWIEGISINIEGGDPNAFNVFGCDYFSGGNDSEIIEGLTCSDSSQCKADEECSDLLHVCVPKGMISASCVQDSSICKENEECNAQLGICVPKQVSASCVQNPSICKENEECNAQLGVCVPKQVSASCVQDPSICKSDEVCDQQSGACVPKQVTVTCTQDPSICKSDEECKAGACVPKQVSGGICDKYPKTKAEYLNVMKTIKTCDDLLNGLDKVDAAFESEGGTEADYNYIQENCAMDWEEESLDLATINRIEELFETCILDLDF